jgi:hypothetical protein
VSNLAKLRKAARAAAIPESDAAGVELAAMLAALLDRTRPLTLRQIADGERPMMLADQLEVVKIVGPQYLRTLTALGLTRAGRGAVPAAAIPTVGSPAGVSADSATHERHRNRFSERRAGG